jgi:autotransporter-associated beta strand protein
VGLTKTGAGTLTLSGTNTYTGGTTINAGVLTIDFSTRTGGSQIIRAHTINSGTTLNLSHTNTTVDNSAGILGGPSSFLGTGTINKTGAGYIDFWNGGGSVDIGAFAGQINIVAGTLGTNNSNWNAGSGLMNVDISSGANLDLRVGSAKINSLTGAGSVGSTFTGNTLTVGNNNGGGTFSGVIKNVLSLPGASAGGTIAFIKNGTGNQILTGANTYTGATQINAGTITVGDGVVTGNILPAATAITNNGAMIFNTPGSVTHTGAISGTGSITKNGAGTLTISSASNNFTGAVNITEGRLVMNAFAGGAIVIPSGTFLEIATSGAGGSGVLTSMTGTGTLVKSGTGTFDISWNSQTKLISLGSGALIDVQAGTLRNGFGDSGDWTNNKADLTIANGATFDVWDNHLSTGIRFDSLNGGTTSSLKKGSGAFNTLVRVGVDNGSGIFSGVISNPSGTLQLTKDGTGTQQLNGINTYSAATTINAGILGGTGSAASSPHTVAAGGTIMGGTGAGNTGTYTTGALTFASSAAKLQVNTNGTTSNSKIVAGAVTLNGATVDVMGAMTAGTYDLITGSSLTGTATLGTNNTGCGVLLQTTATKLQLLVDCTPPTATINQAAAQLDPVNSNPINFTVVFSEAIAPASFTSADITLSGTGTATAGTPTTSDNITWNIPVTATVSGTIIADLAAATVTDVPGNANTAATFSDHTVTYNTSVPTVTNITSSTTNGSYTTAGTVSVQVTFSEIVNVTGTPQLLLETGTTDRQASYASGSGSTTLTFTYTVVAGDTSADLDYQSTTALALNSGTIKNTALTNATLTLVAPGSAGSLGANKAIIIDTTVPALAQITAVPTPTNSTTPSYTFSSSEAGTISYGGDCSSATITATSGNNTITFNTLAAGVHSNCTITVTDPATNVSSALVVTSFTVDTTAPTATINQSAVQGDPTAVNPINFTVIFSKAIAPASFTSADITLSGTGSGTVGTPTTVDNITWTVPVTGTSFGTIIADLNANRVTDVAGNNNTAATFTDHTVTYAAAGITTGPGITILETATGTVSARLNTQPASTVVLDVSSSDTGAATVSPNQLTFTTANWNTAQNVTVTAVSDADILNENVTVTFTVNDALSSNEYDPVADASEAVTVTDTNVAGFTLSKTTSTVAENGDTDTFTVVLSSQPSSNVVLSVTSGATAEATVSPSTLTFTTANWNTPQTVTITGVNDNVDTVGNDTATITVSVVDASSDNSWDPLADQTVVVTATNDDTAGATVVVVDNITGEDGSTGSFTIKLNSQPTASVTVALSSSNTAEGTVPASVTFTTANWNTAQTITVTGVDDVVPVGDGAVAYTIVTGAVTSADPVYTTLNGSTIADVAMFNENNDPAGVQVNVIGTTNEGGGTTILQFKLLSQPTAGASVTIPVSIADNTEGTVSVSSVTIANADWNSFTANQITITGVDDVLVDGDVAYTVTTGDPTSADAGYDALTATDVADPSVTNIDNDVAGITVTQSGGNTAVTEGGATDSYTVVLNTQPSANVVVSLSGGTQVTSSPTTLTFTTSNWNTAQTVTVTAIDDSSAEGVHTGSVSHVVTSPDTNYNGISVPNVSVSITDNDVSSFVRTPAALSLNKNATSTFTVVLSSQPTTDVVFALTSSSITNATVSPSALTFTNLNWNIPQTVTVTGVNNVSLANQTATVTVDVVDASSDTSFATLPNQTVVTTINDIQDTDRDGTANSAEDAGFNGGDGNGDGILDSIQNTVSGAVNSVIGGGAYTTLQATGGCNIVDVFNVVSEATRPTQDTNSDFPLGLNNFNLRCGSNGQSGTITIFYDRVYTTSAWIWKKYNSITNTYTDVTSLVSATIGSQTVGSTPVTKVSFTITDGGTGDEDGLANSRIIDPVGPAVPVAVATPAITQGGGGVIRQNGCNDPKALNYSNFVWHVQSTCVYPTIDLTAEARILACKNLSTVDEIISLSRKNKKDKVKNLQTFLNTVQKENLKIDGIYKKKDVEAVNRFQKKYKKEVLTVQNIKSPTSIWGIFTNKKAKELSGCK